MMRSFAWRKKLVSSGRLLLRPMSQLQTPQDGLNVAQPVQVMPPASPEQAAPRLARPVQFDSIRTYLNDFPLKVAVLKPFFI